MVIFIQPASATYFNASHDPSWSHVLLLLCQSEDKTDISSNNAPIQGSVNSTLRVRTFRHGSSKQTPKGRRKLSVILAVTYNNQYNVTNTYIKCPDIGFEYGFRNVSVPPRSAFFRLGPNRALSITFLPETDAASLPKGENKARPMPCPKRPETLRA